LKLDYLCFEELIECCSIDAEGINNICVRRNLFVDHVCYPVLSNYYDFDVVILIFVIYTMLYNERFLLLLLTSYMEYYYIHN
jgi:hypothetical protein